MLPVIVGSLVTHVLLGILILFKRTRELAKKKLVEFKDKMVWNGIIDTLNTEFLPQSELLTVYIIMYFKESQTVEASSIITLVMIMVVILCSFAGLFYLFYKYTNEEYQRLPYFKSITNLTEHTDLDWKR